MPQTAPLHQLLADDQNLAASFEEYLVCRVYLDQLTTDQRPEGSTARSFVSTRIRAIARQIIAAAKSLYPDLDEDTVGRAADIILGRQPVGKDYYLAQLPSH